MIAKPKSWKLGKVIEKVMASSGISRTPVVVVVVVFFFGIPIYYFDPQLTMWLTCLNLTDVSCTFCNKEVSRIQGTHQVQGAVRVMNTFNLSAESRECFACSSGIFTL